MKRLTVLLATAAIATAVPLSGTASANHACTHPETMVQNRLAVGRTPATGESHWYRLLTNEASRVNFVYNGATTTMQIYATDCTTLLCSTSTQGAICFANAGTWRLRVFSTGGAADYVVTVTPAV